MPEEKLIAEDFKDVDLNKVPYVMGNRRIYCTYSQEKGRYVMPKARSWRQAFSEWWNKNRGDKE
jgi:hypothetical protein